MPNRGTIVTRLASALRANGHEIIVAPVGGERGAQRYLRARVQVAEAVARVRPQILHIHYGMSGLAVPSLRVPIVTSFYGDDLNGTWHPIVGTTLKSHLGTLVSQMTAARSARCIAVSKALRDKLWLKAWRQKTAVIRDAVDPGLFRPLPQEDARRRLGLCDKGVLVLFPHDVTQATKRVELARQAVDAFKASGMRAELWIVNGKPPDEMPLYYAAADVMLITSAREGGPSSAKEALACGVPVVSVSTGDLELFDDAPDGMFRSDPRPADLSRALSRAIEPRNSPRRSLLPKGLTLQAAVQAMDAVYRAAVGPR